MTAESDRIRRLLNDPDLQEAFERVERAIHRGWANTPPTDKEAQSEWHRRLFSLNSVRENLKASIEDGEYEDFLAAESEKPTLLGDLHAWRMKRRS